jgi:hypothetical protein
MRANPDAAAVTDKTRTQHLECLRRDHAAEHDQPNRAALFGGLLERLHLGERH